ncbi:unnamed protein product [Adineta steineri]|uniref:ASCH domain-containing protein n=1 Tax=Adineta steineri TaxID=433720 RepID=A0A815DZK3_9BILA|nr:unnamed protein product [Adineta steineri]CAF3509935.1 unnamed protein product [Adineta steineri]
MPQAQKKKSKYINVFSNEGKERMIVRFPGRSLCECQASKHKLVGNCLKCGRIVCDQEGSGPCFFCGTLVCTRDERNLITSGTREGKQLEEQLLARQVREPDSKNTVNTTDSSSQLSLNDIAQAVAFKNKLIEFDRTSAQRTQVIDDAADYFDSNNKWLSKNQRTKLEKLQSQLNHQKNQKNQKITIDFAGRRVTNDPEAKNDRFYDEARAVHDNDQYELESERFHQQQIPNWDDDDENDLINHNLPGSASAPQWVEQQNIKRPTLTTLSQVTIEDKDRERLRIQDKELMQMTDDGMCLSMHQPWASLLVRGIKMHEGRSWYTSHRGRLWIHAAAKEPDQNVISSMQEFYQSRNTDDEEIDFPSDYPTSVLLGCVDVIDCLDRNTYVEQYPDGESESEYVLICENPQELFFKLPMRGQHKIYKMENHAHQAAKRVLLRRMQ